MPSYGIRSRIAWLTGTLNDNNTCIIWQESKKYRRTRTSSVNRCGGEFVFNWRLNQVCESGWCLRAVAGRVVWHWAARYKTFTERNRLAYDGCAWDVSGPRVVLLSPCFRWGWGSYVLFEQVHLNFSNRNKFIMVLPCGHQVDTFSNVCDFKSLTGYTYDGGYETKSMF
jgi:hypothetical protein